MGNKPVKHDYKPLFDPTTFDIEKWIKYYQNMESNFPRQNLETQIAKCYNYITNIKTINNTEGFMRECAFALGIIRVIKTEDRIKNDETSINYYNHLYEEIYSIVTSVG